jgi:hypothetical protein
MSDEEAHIKKKRTTALKIIVDEMIRKNPNKQREFLAGIFDCQEFLEKQEEPVFSCTRTVNNEQYQQTLYPEFLAVLKENNIDPTTLIGYKQEMKTVYKMETYELTQRICEETGISDNTVINYKYFSEEQSNGVRIFFMLFHLETSGKTKMEIKTIHKENVCKLLNFLRMRKVPVSYDCEWSFHGNRSCTI